MRLSKYPVSSDRLTYYVDIKEYENGIYQMCYQIKLFEKVKRNKYSLLKYISPYYHNCLQTIDYEKEKWLGSYKQMTIHCIRDYEDWLDKEEEKDLKHRSGIKTWNSWDGKVTE